MTDKRDFKNKVVAGNINSFENTALELFHYQATNNQIYRQYIQNLKIDSEKVTKISEIPFLPIEFFKTHQIKTGDFATQVIYQSSGTTLQSRSQHHLPDDLFYKQNAKRIFESFYGPLTEYIFLALLPSYLEQGNSSLVAMVDYFVLQSGQQVPGFYLHDHATLLQNIEAARKTGKKIMLFGVTYALLDLAETVEKGALANVIIMETGGMKGRRKEMIRAELHKILQEAFDVPNIHSEYGMTELLSQAYSFGKGIFQASDTLKIVLRDTNDPFVVSENIKSGGINIIDLANVDSCAFIETKDIGKLNPGGGFEVLGRFDNSDIRGCNLMIG